MTIISTSHSLNIFLLKLNGTVLEYHFFFLKNAVIMQIIIQMPISTAQGLTLHIAIMFPPYLYLRKVNVLHHSKTFTAQYNRRIHQYQSMVNFSLTPTIKLESYTEDSTSRNYHTPDRFCRLNGQLCF